MLWNGEEFYLEGDKGLPISLLSESTLKYVKYAPICFILIHNPKKLPIKDFTHCIL